MIYVIGNKNEIGETQSMVKYKIVPFIEIFNNQKKNKNITHVLSELNIL